MMDVNEYLTTLVKKLSVTKDEKEKIDNSVNYLKGKIWERFQDRLSKVEVFGSYDRGTSLSPSIDKNADVDLLIIFKTNDYQPDTFLKHLNEFAGNLYKRSDVSPDHPAITIELNHVKFELVPAYWKERVFSDDGLMIPAPRNKEIKWITTEPIEFKKQLEKKNKNNDQLILPIIRIFKYWNCLNNYPFTSFYLENFIITHSYSFCHNIRDYFFEVISDLNNTSFEKPLESHVQNLYKKRTRLLGMEKEKLMEYIEQELQTFIPLLE